jgi:hypothetical protein
MTQEPLARSNWWMYRGTPAHTRYFDLQSRDLNSTSVKTMEALYRLHLDGPILSAPAVVDGYIYVRVANYHRATTSLFRGLLLTED